MRVLQRYKLSSARSGINGSLKDYTSFKNKLPRSFHSDGPRSSMSLLIEKFQSKTTTLDKVGDKRMQISSPACLSAQKGTSSENETRTGCLALKEPDERFLHHILEIDTYSGCITKTFHSMIIEADETEAFGQGDVRKPSWLCECSTACLH